MLCEANLPALYGTMRYPSWYTILQVLDNACTVLPLMVHYIQLLERARNDFCPLPKAHPR